MNNLRQTDDFPRTGFKVILDGNPWPRDLCVVSDAARKWDGTECRFALHSDEHDVYSYCAVRVTGRKVRWDDTYRLTIQIDFEQEEAGTCRGEIMRQDGRDPFEITDVRGLLG